MILSYGRRQFRLHFKDATNKEYTRWPVNDLAFRAYLQKTMNSLGDEREAEGAVLKALTSADRIYLRISLARPESPGDYPEACWAQVTGIYTFPDYLAGATFADFVYFCLNVLCALESSLAVTRKGWPAEGWAGPWCRRFQDARTPSGWLRGRAESCPGNLAEAGRARTPPRWCRPPR